MPDYDYELCHELARHVRMPPELVGPLLDGSQDAGMPAARDWSGITRRAAGKGGEDWTQLIRRANRRLFEFRAPGPARRLLVWRLSHVLRDAGGGAHGAIRELAKTRNLHAALWNVHRRNKQ